MRPLTVRWRNFHGFEDTNSLEIRPVTVLLGSNNCGKSSTFLPLLLLKQTLEDDHELPFLSTRGNIVSAGAYADLVHNGDTNLDIQFSIRFPYSEPPRREDCTSAFHYPPARLDVLFSCDGSTGLPELTTFTVLNQVGEKMFTRRKKNGNYSIEGMGFRSGSLNSEFDRHLRRNFIADRPRGFLFRSIEAVMAASRESTHDGKRESSQSVNDYWRTLDHTMYRVVDLLSSIKYLGPLREPPHRLYEVASLRPPGVGQRGERSAELLHTIASDSKLMGELQYWLERFRFTERLSTEEFAPGGFSVYMTPPGTNHRINYSDMGFGLSQVLPLILQVITAKLSDVLICEQPEIHLNPSLQSVLANMFVDLANRGGTSIIETHSEHLLLRLRRLVANGEIDAEKVALYYVERHGDVSSIRSVEIESNGHIDHKSWPEGFFGDALEESIELALAQARDR